MEKELLTAEPYPRKTRQKHERRKATGGSRKLSYTSTIMHGQYAVDLRDYVKDEVNKEKGDPGENMKQGQPYLYWLRWLMDAEWILLLLMGVIMAIISFLMDEVVQVCVTARVWLYRDIFNTSHGLQFFVWILPIVCLILFAVGLTHILAPQAAGSGIPEMKTILRGVVLKEYLTFKTLVAKIIGLTAVLGGGTPIGKEGPFVHIASIVATLLSKFKFRGIYENKSHYNELLAAACAVGIGACFASPIGGVLFSVEVTTSYFAVRNCWRGFFAAVCGAAVFLLLDVWFRNSDTIRAVFLTNFTSEFPFSSQELIIFALMGVICGCLGAGYVWIHKSYVTFIRSNIGMKRFLQKNQLLYPTIIAIVVATLSFPLGTGQFIGAELSTHEQLTQLFSNFTWASTDLSVDQFAVVSQWKKHGTSVFVTLCGYTLYNYLFSIICYTLPVATGSFVPIFKIGAGIGRIVGEVMHIIYPTGVKYGGILSPIIPGGYAVVGAAAFASAATHTISEAVIVFEITGQVTYVIPVMIASAIANVVAKKLQPSLYDSMIIIKKLPYLPDFVPSSSDMYTKAAGDFMVGDIKYFWPNITYQKLNEVLYQSRGIRCLPMVDSQENMLLLGSAMCSELEQMIVNQIDLDRKMSAYRHRSEDQNGVNDHKVQRRKLSRFEVVPVVDNQTLSVESNTLLQLRKRSILEELFVQPPSSTSSDHVEPNNSDNNTNDLSSSSKKVEIPENCVLDMTPEDKKQWENEELSKPIDLVTHNLTIDPSPFQLTERTPMIKVHTLFNLLNIGHAYVTNMGRLVGVVSLRELRSAIEEISEGTKTATDRPMDLWCCFD